MKLELLAGILVSLVAIWGVIATIELRHDPENEDHEPSEPHAGGNK